METRLLCIPKNQSTYEHMVETYEFCEQSGENPINGFIGHIFDIFFNCDFYIIPSTYEDLDDFKEDYYNHTITIDNMQKYQ